MVGAVNTRPKVKLQERICVRASCHRADNERVLPVPIADSHSSHACGVRYSNLSGHLPDAVVLLLALKEPSTSIER